VASSAAISSRSVFCFIVEAQDVGGVAVFSDRPEWCRSILSVSIHLHHPLKRAELVQAICVLELRLRCCAARHRQAHTNGPIRSFQAAFSTAVQGESYVGAMSADSASSGNRRQVVKSAASRCNSPCDAEIRRERTSKIVARSSIATG